MRALPLLLLLLPCLSVQACSSQRLFMPRENPNGTGPGGSPAALYALSAPAHGEVRLWSRGAFRTRRDGAMTTRLHLGFELENTGAEPLRFGRDAVVLGRVELAGGDVLGPLQPVQIDGSGEAAPGSVARVDFEFDFGAEVAPRQIQGFHVHWAVAMAGHVFEQMTPFVPLQRDAWDPWWYGPGPAFYGGYGYRYGWGFYWW